MDEIVISNNNEKLEIKDLTFYRVEIKDGLKLSFDPTFGKWVSADDVDLDESEIAECEDYYSDDESRILLTSAYCGETSITIEDDKGNTNTINVIIRSRFEKICYEELKNLALDNNNNKDWQKMPKSEPVGQLYQLYYMPSLYEFFVRKRIEEAIKDNDWDIVEYNYSKEICTENTEYKIKSADPSIAKGTMDKGIFETYLQGELIPDIILYKNNEDNIEYRVFDVKYKTGKYNTSTRSDRHQILAYAYMWDCKYIGHIFPEKRSDGWLEIDIDGKESVFYKEVACNCSEDNLSEIIKSK